MSPFERGKVHPKFSDANMCGNQVNLVKLEEQLLINFEKLVTETNNFPEANKLGQGSFGSVYRVMLLHLKHFIEYYVELLFTGLMFV